MVQDAEAAGSGDAMASLPGYWRRFAAGPRTTSIAVAVFVAATALPGVGVAPIPETLSLCGEHRAPLAQLIDNAVADGNLVSAGLPASRRSNRVAEYFAVDERYWRGLPDNQRALLAFAAYCRTGHGTEKGIVVIESMEDGTAVGAVVDGEYVDRPERLAKVL